MLPYSTRNAFDLAHGGALATYVDIATTCGLYAFEKKGRTHVSAKLDMDFLAPGKTARNPNISEDIGVPSILIDARINKIGKNMAFTEARIFEEESKMLICTGTHIKGFVNNTYEF